MINCYTYLRLLYFLCCTRCVLLLRVVWSAAESSTADSGLAQLERDVQMIELTASGQQRGEQVSSRAASFSDFASR